jgi:hypothetical protein
MLLLVYAGLGQHTLLGIVVGLCWASGNTLSGYCCWVYMRPRATHITGYCCMVYMGLGQHTLLGIVVGLCGASGNTLYWVLLLLGLCRASGNTLYWVLLFGLCGPLATHITGYCCWFMWVLGRHTLLGIVVGLHISSETAEANNTLINKIMCHYSLFPLFIVSLASLTSYTNLPQSDKSHIHKLAHSPKAVRRMGICYF